MMSQLLVLVLQVTLDYVDVSTHQLYIDTRKVADQCAHERMQPGVQLHACHWQFSLLKGTSKITVLCPVPTQQTGRATSGGTPPAKPHITGHAQPCIFIDTRFQPH